MRFVFTTYLLFILKYKTTQWFATWGPWSGLHAIQNWHFLAGSQYFHADRRCTEHMYTEVVNVVKKSPQVEVDVAAQNATRVRVVVVILKAT